MGLYSTLTQVNDRKGRSRNPMLSMKISKKEERKQGLSCVQEVKPQLRLSLKFILLHTLTVMQFRCVKEKLQDWTVTSVVQGSIVNSNL